MPYRKMFQTKAVDLNNIYILCYMVFFVWWVILRQIMNFSLSVIYSRGYIGQLLKLPHTSGADT